MPNTTPTYYPYSESFAGTKLIEDKRPERERKSAHGSTASLAGANYVRNSVKAVVDAFNGSVTFYVFEPEDPLIQVWQRIFPELFTRGLMAMGEPRSISHRSKSRRTTFD
jgi:uncharacterized protein